MECALESQSLFADSVLPKRALHIHPHPNQKKQVLDNKRTFAQRINYAEGIKPCANPKCNLAMRRRAREDA
jgi:hypothetical protein